MQQELVLSSARCHGSLQQQHTPTASAKQADSPRWWAGGDAYRRTPHNSILNGGNNTLFTGEEDLQCSEY